MKHLFLVVAAMMLAAKSNAQLSEGRHMIGANINYSGRVVQHPDTTNSQPRTTESDKTLNLGINYGSMITDHIMLGIRGNFQNSKGKNETQYQQGFNKGKRMVQTFSAGIFLRYYQKLGSSRFYAFAEAFANFGLGAGTYESSYTGNAAAPNSYSNKFLTTTFNTGIKPGITYFLSKFCALEASMGDLSFSRITDKVIYNKIESSKTTTNAFNSNLNLSISSLLVGITFYFGK